MINYEIASKYKLNKGDTYTFSLSFKEGTTPVNLNDLSNIVVSIYTYDEKRELVRFRKEDLTITDPTSGLATVHLTSSVTENALSTLYIIEVKAISNSGSEVTQKGYLGVFVDCVTKEIHAV
jgi:hypothetical protein